MAWNEQQLRAIQNGRRATLPTYYSAEAQSERAITDDMEAALIVLPSAVKQKASQYIDALISANPVASDHDTVLAEATDQWSANQAAALSELETTVQAFEDLKAGLSGGSQASTDYIDGMAPMLASLSKGFGKIEARMSDLRYFATVAGFAQDFHSVGSRDEYVKEWQSWKRVLLSYR